MSRIVLKFSGGVLKGERENVSNDKLNILLETIKILNDLDHKVAVVVGGGNFMRGREHVEMNRVTADTIGMLGTIMNALYIKDYLEKNGLKAVVKTPFVFPNLIDDLNDEKLVDEYNNNSIVVFGGGIGKSGYSTDSGTVLARDILSADMIIKLTDVDGVYDSDPHTNKNANKFDKLSFKEVLDKDLKVMDRYAIEKCMESNTRILVMNFNKYKDIKKCLDGSNIGTIIEE